MAFAYQIELLTLAIVTTITMGCTPVRKQGGMAVVRQAGASPCFSIADNEFTRRHGGQLALVEVIDDAGIAAWKASFDDKRLFPAQCIAYGAPVSTAAPSKPKPLEFGKIYRVSVVAPMPEEPFQTGSYSADFCLSRQGVDGVVVRQLFSGQRAPAMVETLCAR